MGDDGWLKIYFEVFQIFVAVALVDFVLVLFVPGPIIISIGFALLCALILTLAYFVNRQAFFYVAVVLALLFLLYLTRWDTAAIQETFARRLNQLWTSPLQLSAVMLFGVFFSAFYLRFFKVHERWAGKKKKTK